MGVLIALMVSGYFYHFAFGIIAFLFVTFWYLGSGPLADTLWGPTLSPSRHEPKYILPEVPKPIDPYICSRCGYNCRGVADQAPCPECGKLPNPKEPIDPRCPHCNYDRTGIAMQALCPGCRKPDPEVYKKPMRPIR